MPIQFSCPACGKRYKVADELAGRRAKCKQCQAVMEIPLPEPPPAEEESVDFGVMSAAPSAMLIGLARSARKVSGRSHGLDELTGSEIAIVLAVVVVAATAITGLVTNPKAFKKPFGLGGVGLLLLAIWWVPMV